MSYTQRIKKIIDKWAPLLGLDSWRITYSIENTEGALARVHIFGSRLSAIIRICEEEKLQEEWELFESHNSNGIYYDVFLEKLIIHELLHVLLNSVEDRINSISFLLNNDIKSMWETSVTNELEATIERIAGILCIRKK